MSVCRFGERLLACRCLCLLVPTMLLASCGYLQAQSRVDPQTIATYPAGSVEDGSPTSDPINSKIRRIGVRPTTDDPCRPHLRSDTRTGAINLDCFKFPGSQYLAYREAAGTASSGNRIDDRRIARNRLANVLIKQSDDVCTLEMGRLIADEATVNTALSVLGTGFSAAASIVTGDAAQRALAGASTFSSATRGHIDAEVYRNALAPVVARAIEGKREEQKQALRNHEQNTVATYSVDAMIADVNEYHQTCSFYYGLGLVVKAVDRQAFDQRDRQGAITGSLEAIGLRIQANERTLKTPGLSPAATDAITAQQTALIQEQTRLITERANLEVPFSPSSPAADADGVPQPQDNDEKSSDASHAGKQS